VNVDLLNFVMQFFIVFALVIIKSLPSQTKLIFKKTYFVITIKKLIIFRITIQTILQFELFQVKARKYNL